MRLWPLVLAVGCLDGDPAAVPSLDTGAAATRFVGERWEAPPVLPWQAPTWCDEVYGDRVRSQTPACVQRVRLNEDGTGAWLVTVWDLESPQRGPYVIDERPLRWSDAGTGLGAADYQQLDVDGRRWIVTAPLPDQAARLTTSRTVVVAGTRLIFERSVD